MSVVDLVSDLEACVEYKDVINRANEPLLQLEAFKRFTAEAYSKWPKTIQYAIDLENEVDRLRNELNIMQDQLKQRGSYV